MKVHRFLFLFFVFVFQLSTPSPAQQTALKAAVNVFIDCQNCDFDYIRSEISFVNYVIDRKNADVYILITSERRGGGGEKYTVNFTGRSRFANQSSVLYFTTQEDDTQDQIRVKMVRTLKLGLIQFVADTPIARRIHISYTSPKKQIAKSDPWDSWVFRTRLSGNLKGEKSAKGKALDASIGVERITEAWKIRMGAYTHYQEEAYQINGAAVVGISRLHQFESMLVKSLSSHWSLGAGVQASSSTYSNLRASFMAYPAIEYNIFPYSQSTRREFRMWYGAGLGFNDYFEKTIYDKNKEWLWGQRVGIEVQTRQEWGRIDVNIEGMNYFPDMSRNHLRVSGDVSLHLVKGLAFSVHGGVSAIHDQIALPKGEASGREILLEIRELETQYNYWFGLGFEYTFGSIYNNIVNSRFGNGG